MSFTEHVSRALAQPLDPAHVRQRVGPNGTKLDYLDGYRVIDNANKTFGPGGWTRDTVSVELVHGPVTEKRTRNGKEYDVWVVAYAARVRVTVFGEGGRAVFRDGIGFGSAEGSHISDVMEQAMKTAETDATKRALMTFGYSLGLALYDKDRENVKAPPAPLIPASSEKSIRQAAQAAGVDYQSLYDEIVRLVDQGHSVNRQLLDTAVGNLKQAQGVAHTTLPPRPAITQDLDRHLRAVAKDLKLDPRALAGAAERLAQAQGLTEVTKDIINSAAEGLKGATA